MQPFQSQNYRVIVTRALYNLEAKGSPMSTDFLDGMLSAPVEVPKQLGICGCGHEGIYGNEYCYICLYNREHALSMERDNQI